MACVLIVDDESPVRELLRDILEEANHTVFEAENGETGLKRALMIRPDLIITDILMPKVGGLTLIGEVREAYPRSKIIAISGGGKNGQLNFLKTALTFPGVRILNKPFTPEELLSIASELLKE